MKRFKVDYQEGSGTDNWNSLIVDADAVNVMPNSQGGCVVFYDHLDAGAERICLIICSPFILVRAEVPGE